MAKLSSINKNEKRKKLVKQYAAKYEKLKAIADDRSADEKSDEKRLRDQSCEWQRLPSLWIPCESGASLGHQPGQEERLDALNSRAWWSRERRTSGRRPLRAVQEEGRTAVHDEGDETPWTRRGSTPSTPPSRELLLHAWAY